MSPGSNPNVDSLACCLRLRRGQAPAASALLQPLGQPGNHPLGQDLAEPLPKLVELDAAVLVQGDAQPAVVRPAHEQHHVVDAEVWGDLTHEAHGDLDVLGPCFVLDLLEALQTHLPGQLVARPGRRPEPQHEFPGIDLWEQFGTDLEAQHRQDDATRDEIDRDHQPAEPDEQVHRL